MNSKIQVSWEHMTPGEIWRAIKIAPKVAGLWQHNDSVGYASRWTPHALSADRGLVASVGLKKGPSMAEGLWGYVAGIDRPVFGEMPNKEMAMQKADEILRETGWLLVEEEVDDV
jgi:hypothetical protein